MRDKKNKGAIFLLEEQHENFVAVVTTWGILAATNARWKWAEVKQKVNKNTYDISSKKCVTKKFLELSRCSHTKKQRQRKVQKKVCCKCKDAFLLIRPIVNCFITVLVPFAAYLLAYYTILYFVWTNFKYRRELDRF